MYLAVKSLSFKHLYSDIRNYCTFSYPHSKLYWGYVGISLSVCLSFFPSAPTSIVGLGLVWVRVSVHLVYMGFIPSIWCFLCVCGFLLLVWLKNGVCEVKKNPIEYTELNPRRSIPYDHPYVGL